MYKQWREGDERLLPIYPQYANTMIRWGKEEVEEAIINKNKRQCKGVSLLGRKSSQKMGEASNTSPVLVVSLVKSVAARRERIHHTVSNVVHLYDKMFG